ncbi:hypothetical protein [Nitrosomonas cryotolerans]|uniref:hypothetical protein n=1 Tax=Nitrosomonas cryotolerans TaxID=44575 RepID=UPI0015A62A72|nr:hypothetical protein [Nitrosomonas cryotolerans]
MMHRDGVKGVGMMKTADGKDGIVVYVVDQRVLSQLPATVGGFPVVGEITGEIRAL